MKINLRQEIAMWVLGLLWTGLAFAALAGSADIGNVLQEIALLLALLVPACLIVFSLRDRKKPN
jgi:drug/metabolite transporter (DMT)-like permease